ncbi:Protein kinase domain-containing protein [Ruaniaceae bacterium KH17]|nr:Protein kinase domain-containing protein [Ruaniaceae bacterium KH17]
MQEIGGYRLERQIGAGGMGTVWLAYDADDHPVAFKLLHPHISKDPNARARLQREVELLHRVRGARVAQVVDAEVDDDDAFVVTELIDGPTLSQDVDREGPFNERELEGLAVGLAEALHSIHRVGVVHRDLKPGNVMMSPDGPVIIDFGISQIADDTRLTQTGMVTGTPGYLDPEVINGGEVTSTCDWWSWAAVLAYAATGRAPYGSGPALTVIKRMSDHVVDLDGVDPLIATAIRAALHPKAEHRLDPDSVIAVLGGQWGELELSAAIAQLEAEKPAMIPPTRVMPAEAGATDLLPGGTARYPTPAVRSTEQLHTPGAAASPYWPAPGQQWPAPAPPPLQPPAWALPAPPARFVVFSLAVLCVAAAAIWPFWSAVAILALTLIAGTWGRVANARRVSTMTRGIRRGDGARSLAGIPVQLVRAALTMLIPVALVGGLIVGGLYLSNPYRFPAAPALWAAAGLLAILVWVGPGSRFLRDGARLAVRDLFPLRAMRVVLIVLAWLGVIAIGLLVLNGIDVSWVGGVPTDRFYPWP